MPQIYDDPVDQPRVDDAFEPSGEDEAAKQYATGGQKAGTYHPNVSERAQAFEYKSMAFAPATVAHVVTKLPSPDLNATWIGELMNAAVPWVLDKTKFAGIPGQLLQARMAAQEIDDPNMRKVAMDFLRNIQRLPEAQQVSLLIYLKGVRHETETSQTIRGPSFDKDTAGARALEQVFEGATGVPLTIGDDQVPLADVRGGPGLSIFGQGDEPTNYSAADLTNTIRELFPDAGIVPDDPNFFARLIEGGDDWFRRRATIKAAVDVMDEVYDEAVSGKKKGFGERFQEGLRLAGAISGVLPEVGFGAASDVTRALPGGDIVADFFGRNARAAEAQVNKALTAGITEVAGIEPIGVDPKTGEKVYSQEDQHRIEAWAGGTNLLLLGAGSLVGRVGRRVRTVRTATGEAVAGAELAARRSVPYATTAKAAELAEQGIEARSGLLAAAAESYRLPIRKVTELIDKGLVKLAKDPEKFFSNGIRSGRQGRILIKVLQESKRRHPGTGTSAINKQIGFVRDVYGDKIPEGLVRTMLKQPDVPRMERAFVDALLNEQVGSKVIRQLKFERNRYRARLTELEQVDNVTSRASRLKAAEDRLLELRAQSKGQDVPETWFGDYRSAKAEWKKIQGEVDEIYSLRARIKSIDYRIATTFDDSPMLKYPKQNIIRAAANQAASTKLGKVLEVFFAPMRAVGFDPRKFVDELPRYPELHVPGTTNSPPDAFARNADALGKYMHRAGVDRETIRLRIGELSEAKSRTAFYDLIERKIFGEGGDLDKALHPNIDPELRSRIVHLHNRPVESRTRSQLVQRVETPDGLVTVRTPILGVERRPGTKIPIPSRDTEFLETLRLPDVQMIIDADSWMSRGVSRLERHGKLAASSHMTVWRLPKFLLRLSTLTLKPFVMLVRLPAMMMRIQMEQSLRISSLGFKPVAMPEGFSLFPGGIPVPTIHGVRVAKSLFQEGREPLLGVSRVGRKVFGDEGWKLLSPDPRVKWATSPDSTDMGMFWSEMFHEHGVESHWETTSEFRQGGRTPQTAHWESFRNDLEQAYASRIDRTLASMDLDVDEFLAWLESDDWARRYMAVEQLPEIRRAYPPEGIKGAADGHQVNMPATEAAKYVELPHQLTRGRTPEYMADLRRSMEENGYDPDYQAPHPMASAIPEDWKKAALGPPRDFVKKIDENGNLMGDTASRIYGQADPSDFFDPEADAFLGQLTDRVRKYEGTDPAGNAAYDKYFWMDENGEPQAYLAIERESAVSSKLGPDINLHATRNAPEGAVIDLIETVANDAPDMARLVMSKIEGIQLTKKGALAVQRQLRKWLKPEGEKVGRIRMEWNPKTGEAMIREGHHRIAVAADLGIDVPIEITRVNRITRSSVGPSSGLVTQSDLDNIIARISFPERAGEDAPPVGPGSLVDKVSQVEPGPIGGLIKGLSDEESGRVLNALARVRETKKAGTTERLFAGRPERVPEQLLPRDHAPVSDPVRKWVEDRVAYLRQITRDDPAYLDTIVTGRTRALSRIGPDKDTTGRSYIDQYNEQIDKFQVISETLREKYATNAPVSEIVALQQERLLASRKIRRLQREHGDIVNAQKTIALSDKRKWRGHVKEQWAESKMELPEQLLVDKRIREFHFDGGVLDDIERFFIGINNVLYRPFKILNWADMRGTRGSLFYQAYARQRGIMKARGYDAATADAIAFTRAGELTRDVMYDLTARTSVQRALQDIMWFAPAYQEVLYTWLVKIPAEAYWPFGATSLALKGAGVIGLLKDAGIIKENSDGENVIIYPGLARFVSNITGTKVPDITFGKLSGLNLVTTSIGPSLSTVPNWVLGKAALEYGGIFKDISDVMQPYGPDTTLLPQPVTFAFEALTGSPPPLLSPDRTKADWDRSFDLGIQYAFAELQGKDIMPPRPEDYGRKDNKTGEWVLTPDDQAQYEKANKLYINRLMGLADRYARGVAFVRLIGSTVSPQALYATSKEREQWDEFWNQIIVPDGFGDQGLSERQRNLIDSYVEDHPLSLAYTVFYRGQGEKVDDLPFPEEMDDAFYDAFYTGESQTLNPQDFRDKLLAIESRRYYQAQLERQLKEISPTMDPWELLTHGSERKEAIDDYTESWDRWRHMNPAMAALMDRQSALWKQNNDVPIESFESERLGRLYSLLRQVSPMLTGESNIRPDYLRDTLREVSLLYSEKGEFGDPNTNQEKAMAWYFENVYIPRIEETIPLYDAATAAEAQGLPSNEYYQQIREIYNRPYAKYKGQVVPGVEAVFFGNRNPEEREAAITSWRSKPVTWLSDFQLKKAGYNVTPETKSFLDNVIAYDNAMYAHIRESGIKPSSNDYDALIAERDRRLGDAAAQAGRDVYFIWQMEEAAPYQRLNYFGQGSGVPYWQEISSAVDQITKNILASDLSPRSFSELAAGKKQILYRGIYQARQLEQSLDDYFVDLSHSFPLPDGSFREGAALYEAVFFGNFREEDIPFNVAAAAAGLESE